MVLPQGTVTMCWLRWKVTYGWWRLGREIYEKCLLMEVVVCRLELERIAKG